MNSDITTTDPLQDIGGAVMQLTYANMMELASRIRDHLIDIECVDESICETHLVAEALSLTATYLFTQEGDA
jgi:hypothetical protein